MPSNHSGTEPAELELLVRRRWNNLTKPPGSLGILEDVVVRLAIIQGRELPSAERKGMYVFCGDHGVTAEGVSPFPASVTREMVRNFVRGGAAINVLCRREGIEPVVVDMGVAGDPTAGVLDERVAPGTDNFAQNLAMTREQAVECLDRGRRLAHEASRRFDIVGIGEMGIGNTTTAAAILSVFASEDPERTVGPGTGANPEQIARKADVIRRALRLHRPDPNDGLQVLSAIGGFETGGMAGFILGASEVGLAVVLDGFPGCSAALIARALSPDALRTCFFGHRSAEPGHEMMIRLLGAHPLLNLGMRLGEGTGAALAIGIIDAALRLYREMATFDDAGVSGAGLS